MGVIQLDKAVFGQVNQGHGLRCCSFNRELFNSASSLLDVPDVIPPGVNPFPYISGFPLNEHYIIAKTFLDVNASRAGMVIVYALAIRLEEIIYLKGIDQIFELLPKQPCEENDFLNQYTIIDISKDIITTNTSSNNKLAELLVANKPGPIVHVGLLDFETSITSIWGLLWPSMRENFIFRLSLSPRDCVEPLLPSLVCTSESLISRWPENCKRIDKINQNESYTLAGQALYAGYKEYEEFITKFEIEIKSASSLALLAQAKIKYVSHSSNFSECLTLIRLLEVLSPNPTSGSDSKLLLIEKFEKLIKICKTDELLKLRNLKGISFSSFQIIWDSISTILGNNSFLAESDECILQMIRGAYDVKNEIFDNWKNAIQIGLYLALENPKSLIYPAIWRWFNIDLNLIIKLLNEINITSLIEEKLLVYAPQDFSKQVEEIILPFSRDHNLLQLHGLILGSQYSALEAISKQLEIDCDISYTKGIEALISRTKSIELLQASIVVKDERVEDFVVYLAAKNSTILSQANHTSNESLNIWKRALLINPNVWNAPNNYKEILFFLLDDYISSKKSAHLELICLLSISPIADLCDFSNREDVWNLPHKVLSDNFLNQTALGWYTRALKLEVIVLDPILENSIYNIPNLIQKMKQDSLYNIKGVLNIFSLITLFSESEFINWFIFWLDSSSRKVVEDMSTIGDLIQRKIWNEAAKVVFDKSKSSSANLNIILSHCKELLLIWDRITLGSVTDEDKWQALLQLLESLYPKGPEEQDIWTRAGGKDYRLWLLGSGSDNWRKALKKIRQGSKPNPSNLINVAQLDFPNNPQISILSRLF